MHSPCYFVSQIYRDLKSASLTLSNKHTHLIRVLQQHTSCASIPTLLSLCSDYRAMPGLDQYETNDLDDEDEHDVTYEEAQAARLQADRELDRRDMREGRATGRRQRLPEALEGMQHAQARQK